MTREIGRVTSVENGEIEVKVPTGDGCALCGGKAACSFSGPDSAYRIFRLPFQFGIQKGSRLTLEIRGSAQIISALIIFTSPVILFLAIYLMMSSYLHFPNSELWSGLATLVFYSITLIFSNHWLSRSAMFQPRIISIETGPQQPVAENTS